MPSTRAIVPDELQNVKFGRNCSVTGWLNIMVIVFVIPAYTAFTVMVPTRVPDTELSAIPALFVEVRFADIGYMLLLAVKPTVAPLKGYPRRFTIAVSWSGLPFAAWV